MAYNEQLAASVRELLAEQPIVEEKKMFQGLGFMVNDKLCICINKHDILCRIGEERVLIEIESGTCRQMMHNGRAMKDYVFIEESQIRGPKDLAYWLALCLDFNPKAKSSKNKKG